MRNYCSDFPYCKRSFTAPGVAALLRGPFVRNIVKHVHGFLLSYHHYHHHLNYRCHSSSNSSGDGDSSSSSSSSSSSVYFVYN